MLASSSFELRLSRGSAASRELFSLVAVSSTGAEAFASIDMSLTFSSLVSSSGALFVLEVELPDFDCSF